MISDTTTEGLHTSIWRRGSLNLTLNLNPNLNISAGVDGDIKTEDHPVGSYRLNALDYCIPGGVAVESGDYVANALLDEPGLTFPPTRTGSLNINIICAKQSEPYGGYRVQMFARIVQSFKSVAMKGGTAGNMWVKDVANKREPVSKRQGRCAWNSDPMGGVKSSEFQESGIVSA